MNPSNPTRYAERNIRLLNRHWEWLQAQPRGVHASLRLLVEAASKDEDGRYRAARAREACYFAMRDMAGDRPHFEEAVRALFANDVAELHRLIASWPLPVRTHIDELMAPVWASEGAM